MFREIKMVFWKSRQNPQNTVVEEFIFKEKCVPKACNFTKKQLFHRYFFRILTAICYCFLMFPEHLMSLFILEPSIYLKVLDTWCLKWSILTNKLKKIKRILTYCPFVNFQEQPLKGVLRKRCSLKKLASWTCDQNP